MENIENLVKEETAKVVNQLLSQCSLQKDDIIVVGCSSSEVIGSKIGSNSSKEIGQIIFKTINDICKEKQIFLAAQCCEHLNRALVVEEEIARKQNLEIVSVVPWLKGGGSFGTAAYYGFKKPVVVEHIKADAGIDIGLTLIGMHLKHVAVPVRVEQKTIGEARVVCAKTRPKLIGGERAHYTEEPSSR